MGFAAVHPPSSSSLTRGAPQAAEFDEPEEEELEAGGVAEGEEDEGDPAHVPSTRHAYRHIPSDEEADAALGLAPDAVEEPPSASASAEEDQGDKDDAEYRPGSEEPSDWEEERVRPRGPGRARKRSRTQRAASAD